MSSVSAVSQATEVCHSPVQDFNYAQNPEKKETYIKVKVGVSTPRKYAPDKKGKLDLHESSPKALLAESAKLIQDAMDEPNATRRKEAIQAVLCQLREVMVSSSSKSPTSSNMLNSAITLLEKYLKQDNTIITNDDNSGMVKKTEKKQSQQETNIDKNEKPPSPRVLASSPRTLLSNINNSLSKLEITDAGHRCGKNSDIMKEEECGPSAEGTPSSRRTRHRREHSMVLSAESIYNIENSSEKCVHPSLSFSLGESLDLSNAEYPTHRISNMHRKFHNRTRSHDTAIGRKNFYQEPQQQQDEKCVSFSELEASPYEHTLSNHRIADISKREKKIVVIRNENGKEKSQKALKGLQRNRTFDSAYFSSIRNQVNKNYDYRGGHLSGHYDPKIGVVISAKDEDEDEDSNILSSLSGSKDEESISGRSGEKSSTNPTTPWICNVCTLKNKPLYLQCAACNSIR